MSSGEGALREALRLMQAALELLDEADSAHNVAAHLDLAIHRLKEAYGLGDCDGDDGWEKGGAKGAGDPWA